jgi:mannose-6-phosphate isomerase-like protein (cupin superfamily)
MLVDTPKDGPINLQAKLAQFDERWAPRTVTSFNGHDVMVVKVEGEFVWHSHEETDDFFYVLSGELEVMMRDRTVKLRPGELYVVPKGVEHCTRARAETHLLLIEPSGTPNTGQIATAAPRRKI